MALPTNAPVPLRLAAVVKGGIEPDVFGVFRGSSPLELGPRSHVSRLSWFHSGVCGLWSRRKRLVLVPRVTGMLWNSESWCPCHKGHTGHHETFCTPGASGTPCSGAGPDLMV